METNTDKVFSFFDQMWPFISGIVLTIIAVIKLWWSDRQAVKRRIIALEVIAEASVSKSELQACRDDVRVVDESNLEKIYGLIRDNNENNAQQHQDIMHEIIELHRGDKK